MSIEPIAPRQSREQSLSLIKAIRILRCFTHDCPERTLAEIVSLTGMARTICYRLLNTLNDEGLAHRDQTSGKYRLSMSLFAMGSTALGIGNLATVASHAMSQLSAQTHDTVLLIVEHDGTGMCIARVDGDYPIQQNALTVGRAWPLHVGGAPFCILSFLSAQQREQILSRPLEVFTSHTVTDPVLIEQRIRCVKEQGFAVGNEDAVDYLVAIGAPVFSHEGKIIAAISIGGLTQRYPEQRINEVAQLVRLAAADISAKLGYQAPAVVSHTPLLTSVALFQQQEVEKT